MMARIDKSLLKLWVWFIACIIAYNPEPLAGESPDIDVAMTIPELDLQLFSCKLGCCSVTVLDK